MLLKNESSEIFSRRPGFLSRWALLIFLIILLLSFITTWFIKYPDIIEARAKLISINASVSVIAKKDGKLTRLLIRDQDIVTKKSIIGTLESTADFDQVQDLESTVDSISSLFSITGDGNLPFLSVKAFENLGELQQVYQVFLLDMIGYNNYSKGGFFEKKKLFLEKDLSNIRLMGHLLAERKMSHQQDVELAEKTFEMNETLQKEGAISELEYRNEKSKLIIKQLTIPQINEAILANEAQLNNREKELLELRNTISQQTQIFQQSLYTIKSSIEDWKDKHLLVARVNGKINLAGFIQENQQLKAGQTVCFITPGNSDFFAEMLIPQRNFGKVKKGAKVLLKFASYPSQEFGDITGRIDFISEVPTDSGYLAKITIPNGLITTHNKKLQYKEGLTANAQIITANMRLFNRLYYGIIKKVER